MVGAKQASTAAKHDVQVGIACFSVLRQIQIQMFARLSSVSLCSTKYPLLPLAIRPFHNSNFSPFNLCLSSKFVQNTFYAVKPCRKVFGEQDIIMKCECGTIARLAWPAMTCVCETARSGGDHLGRVFVVSVPASQAFPSFRSLFQAQPQPLLPSSSFSTLPVRRERICHHFNQEVIARVNRVSVILLLLH